MTLVDDHARFTDPRSSERTVRAIVVDVSYAELIMRHAEHVTSSSPTGRAWFTDTELWRACEAMCDGRRFQRNVIARARGRMVKHGLLVPVGEHDFEGVRLEHYALPTRDPEQLALL